MKTIRIRLLCAAILTAWAAPAQTPAMPAFEFASVKRVPETPAAGGAGMALSRSFRGKMPPLRDGKLNYPSVTLFELIKRAYALANYEIVGPSWMESERYAVIAKPPEGSTEEQYPQMLQTLLAERFHLTTHRESKPITAYALVAKGKSKLPESDDTPEAVAADPELRKKFEKMSPGLMVFNFKMGYLMARKIPMTQLAEFFAVQLDRQVTDETELPGAHTFALTWTGDAESTPTGPDPLIGHGWEIAEALPRIGLKLEKRNATATVLVIDRVDKVPTDN